LEKLIIRCRVLGRGDKDDEDGMGAIEEDIFLSQLENTMLSSVRLRGVKDIKRVFLLEHNKVTISDEGNIEARKEKLIQTAVLRSSTFGHRKAAHGTITRELRGVIEFDGFYVNYRHLALLCDLMTHRGMLMAITRHGINCADTGALMRCSFEETVEILMEAASVGEKR